MKILVDSANIDVIDNLNKLKIIDGVTTNPSLIAKENAKIDIIIPPILNIIKGDVSVEVLSTSADAMVQEGKKYADLGPNVVVKVPVTNEGLIAITKLSKMGIKTNATLVFDEVSALLAAKAGATYVSVFVGRLFDNNIDGIQVLKNIRSMLSVYELQTKVIAASIRNLRQLNEVINTGVELATIPSQILEEAASHPLTLQGIKKFEQDYHNL